MGALKLVAFEDQPGRIAATKVDATVPDGQFFLDFTRPLEVIRWLGTRNRFVGLAVGLLVPVIHQVRTQVVMSSASTWASRTSATFAAYGEHTFLRSPRRFNKKQMA